VDENPQSRKVISGSFLHFFQFFQKLRLYRVTEIQGTMIEHSEVK